MTNFYIIHNVMNGYELVQYISTYSKAHLEKVKIRSSSILWTLYKSSRVFVNNYHY